MSRKIAHHRLARLVSRKTALFVAVSLGFSACGLLSRRGPLEQTADRLGDIRSGNLSLELAATTAEGAKTGFRLEGPFSLRSGASLPAADLSYHQFGPGQSRPLAFISTGKAAFIEVGDQAYELPPERVESLKGGKNGGEGGPFGRLKITDWVTDPTSTAGRRVDGVPTQVVRGKLEVATALNNIFEVAGDLGQPDLPKLEGEEAKRLDRAVKSATMELTTGTQDRLLRRLSLRVNLAADGPQDLGAEIQKLLGVKFRLSLALHGPNKPVKVSPPRNPLPFSVLESQ